MPERRFGLSEIISILARQTRLAMVGFGAAEMGSIREMTGQWVPRGTAVQGRPPGAPPVLTPRHPCLRELPSQPGPGGSHTVKGTPRPTALHHYTTVHHCILLQNSRMICKTGVFQ